MITHDFWFGFGTWPTFKMDCSATVHVSVDLSPSCPSIFHGNTTNPTSRDIQLDFLPLTSNQAWYASEFVNEDSYIVHLSDDYKAELDSALLYFKSMYQTIGILCANNRRLRTGW